ncbi:MAG TPA: ComF family protein [Ktedonobacteraceae bacterium]|nr:ComF family protein [Ktedonobacteraceae bacterium]
MGSPQIGKNILQRSLDLLFPPRCIGCGSSGKLLCEHCIAGIQPPPGPRCQHCSSPLEEGTNPPLCQNCQRRSSNLASIHAISTYQGILRSAIHALKYEGQTRLAQPLGQMLAQELQGCYQPGEIDLLMPVPLHAQRLRERGYNHSLLLALFCAEACGLPIDQASLVREKPTTAQVGLKVTERLQNVQDAFTCLIDQAIARGARGKTLLLIDDVYTTGATLEACASALKACGVSNVHGLVLACAGRRQHKN